MKFIKPVPFNGQTFLNECKNVKIKIDSFYDDGEGNLFIKTDETSEIVLQNVLNNHNGNDITSEKISLRQSALAKLAALGLTEEEIAAL